MRRSQAPSIRSTIKPHLKCQKTTTVQNLSEKSSEGAVKRSTDSVLKLLLGANEDTECNNSTDYLSIEDKEQQLDKEEETQGDSVQFLKADLIYNVVYCKQSTRKHKVWEGDGTIEVGCKVITLRDDAGKVLGTCKKSKTIEEGSRLFVGSKEVEVIELAGKNFEVTKEQTNPVRQIIKKKKVDGKKFVVPRANALGKSKSGFFLPEPNDEHQWQFNPNGSPITQVCIEGSLSRNLRQHQLTGITFLYECIMGFKSTNISGAILADEMGLGKTLQTITLIWTLLKQGPYGNKPVLKKVLIVTPSSLTVNWHNEFIKWLGREKLVPYVVDSKKKPQNLTGPVMIISYEMFVRCYEDVKEIAFDLLVCDEGHRLKNGNIRTTQLLQQLNCPKRILLTGTPIQNDLKEFYTLVDFVNPNILGSPVEFRRTFEDTILASRQPSASEEIVLLGEECAANLNRKTCLFLLRRTKEVLNNYLPSKTEIVVFCRTTDIQTQIYNYTIDLLIENNENLLGDSDGYFHLSVITSLKKICNHPALLWKKDQITFKEDPLLSKLREKFCDVIENYAMESSSKLTVALNFLCELKERFPKEKVVIVSNSTQTLDLLEKQIVELGYTTCRLDGSTPTAQRSGLVEKFNRNYSSSFVFLLSSKAGGVGLNLTGASRLILFDSDWNPATDLQAMSRIWRDGQKKSVYMYRFVTTGTIEEKIFQRQINKQGLCDGIVDPQKANSIKLSQEELKDIFSYCECETDCLTHEALSCKCSKTGEIPAVAEEQRTCQLMRQSNSILKMNELLHWEHHGLPISASLLTELCLSASEGNLSFVFRSCKT